MPGDLADPHESWPPRLAGAISRQEEWNRDSKTLCGSIASRGPLIFRKDVPCEECFAGW
jgi:hypothetical protein